MSTPSFVAQGNESLVPIRFYTPFDPYFYTVDNRPLRDIEANLQSLGANGVDSARRAVLLSQLNVSRVFAELFSTSNQNGFVEGLPVTLTSPVLTIGQGSLYVRDVLNSGSSTPVVKQALHVGPTNFTLTVPDVTLGNAKNYLVQAKFVSLDQTTMLTSNLPYLDAANDKLPCVLLNGELVLGIKEGVSAASGSQVTPTADAGWIPLYVVTVMSGMTVSVQMHSLAPTARRASQTTQLFSGNTLPDGSTTTLNVPVSIKKDMNPFLPLKVKILYSVNTTGGNVVVDLRYRKLNLGNSTLTTSTLAGQDLIGMPAFADSLAEFTTSSAVIPPSAFAGFVNGTWAVTGDMLQMYLGRSGSDSRDTATGTVTVHQVDVFQ